MVAYRTISNFSTHAEVLSLLFCSINYRFCFLFVFLFYHLSILVSVCCSVLSIIDFGFFSRLIRSNFELQTSMNRSNQLYLATRIIVKVHFSKKSHRCVSYNRLKGGMGSLLCPERSKIIETANCEYVSLFFNFIYCFLICS